MEPKLLLIRAITLLFKESLFKTRADWSIGLVSDILGMIKLPETGAEFSGVRNTLVALMSTLKALIETPEEGTIDKDTLLQRIRVAAGEDESVFEAFKLGVDADQSIKEIDGDEALVELRKQCRGLIQELRDQVNVRRFGEISRALYQKAFSSDATVIGSRKFIQDMRDALGDLVTDHDRSIRGMVNEVYFDNEANAADILERAKEAMSIEGAMIFGQQALNEACYDNHGILRGEYWLVSALSHHYKSGFGLNAFVDLPLLNKPWMVDPAKKPLIMHVSTENALDKNVLMVYQLLMERETNEACDTSGVDPVLASHYIKQRLSVNGYHTYMCRVDPSDTAVADIKELIEIKEAEGYEIHAVVFDYPPMLSQEGLTKGPAGTELRDIHRRLRNLFSKRQTACIAFHQLGPSAVALDRAGVEDFVKVVAGKNHYDGSTKIFQELDVDITIHIETIGEEGWLTMQWAKHRKPKRTPKHLWYAAMRLSDVGGLRPDVVRHPDGTIEKLAPNFVRDLKPIRERNGGGGDWYQRAIHGDGVF